MITLSSHLQSWIPSNAVICWAIEGDLSTNLSMVIIRYSLICDFYNPSTTRISERNCFKALPLYFNSSVETVSTSRPLLFINSLIVGLTPRLWLYTSMDQLHELICHTWLCESFNVNKGFLKISHRSLVRTSIWTTWVGSVIIFASIHLSIIPVYKFLIFLTLLISSIFWTLLIAFSFLKIFLSIFQFFLYLVFLFLVYIYSFRKYLLFTSSIVI